MPGFAVEVQVLFKPDEYKYYSDAIRIMTEVSTSPNVECLTLNFSLFRATRIYMYQYTLIPLFQLTISHPSTNFRTWLSAEGKFLLD